MSDSNLNSNINSNLNSNLSQHQAFEKVWGNLPGLGALAAVNHTSIGRRFMLTGAAFFLLGGLLAMLMRTQLALPEQDIIAASTYSQLFTMHGTVMMFLFAIPILEGMAIYLIPKLIGARDLVFPRISSLGYYCYLFGGLIVVSSLFLNMAPNSGWFMYTPLSSSEFSPGLGSDFWLLGITFVEISAVAAGVELTVSILRSRAPGMTLSKMPIFCWYILVTALMIVFGFPPLILASILLELERAAGLPFFDVAAGGDSLLWQHLFWLFGHPEVYIIFLPGAGVVSTLIPVFAQRPLLGYRWIVMSLILTGFISFALWVHHMYAVGIPHLAEAFFSAASMLVAVPTGIQLFAWLGTLWVGKVIFSLPMLWIFGFLVVFVTGGLTGVMLALVPFDWQVHDTHFVVAHMHYVLVGGMFFPLMAALYYWLPHLSGRMASKKLGHCGFWLVFIGFNTTFLLMHLTGLLGMPRRVYTYEAGMGWDWLNLISSVGGFIMAAGIAVIILDVALHYRFARRAPSNPWNADTLEWATRTPPSAYNFLNQPVITSRHPLWDQPEVIEQVRDGEHEPTDISHSRRELYGTSAISGALKETMHLPTNSWWPLASATALAVVCLSLLNRVYPLALVALAVAAVFLFRWSWENGAHPRAAPLSADESDLTDPPLHSRTFDGPGLWGMVFTLMADATLYLSLIFGWFYLWTVSPNWQVPETFPLELSAMVACGLLLTGAVVLHARTVKHLRQGNGSGLFTKTVMTFALGLLHTAALIAIIATANWQPTELTHDATLLVMLYYLLFHSGVATIAMGLQSWRVKLGYVSLKLPYEPVVLNAFWLYTLGVYWLSVVAFMLIPSALGGA